MSKASPVVAGDVFSQFKAEISFPDKLKEAQQLKGDYTCDGIGDGNENDISIEIEKYTPAKAMTFTGADVCPIAIRTDDQICAPYRLFWKSNGKPDDRLLVTRKIMP